MKTSMKTSGEILAEMRTANGIARAEVVMPNRENFFRIFFVVDGMERF